MLRVVYAIVQLSAGKMLCNFRQFEFRSNVSSTNAAIELEGLDLSEN